MFKAGPQRLGPRQRPVGSIRWLQVQCGLVQTDEGCVVVTLYDI